MLGSMASSDKVVFRGSLPPVIHYHRKCGVHIQFRANSLDCEEPKDVSLTQSTTVVHRAGGSIDSVPQHARPADQVLSWAFGLIKKLVGSTAATVDRRACISRSHRLNASCSP